MLLPPFRREHSGNVHHDSCFTQLSVLYISEALKCVYVYIYKRARHFNMYYTDVCILDGCCVVVGEAEVVCIEGESARQKSARSFPAELSSSFLYIDLSTSIEEKKIRRKVSKNLRGADAKRATLFLHVLCKDIDFARIILGCCCYLFLFYIKDTVIRRLISFVLASPAQIPDGKRILTNRNQNSNPTVFSAPFLLAPS